MATQVTGKNVDTSEAFSAYVEDKISAVVSKYLSREADSHVRVEKERGLFRTNCSVRLASGLTLEAHGEGGDAYASADNAIHKLETRVRRHKSRLKSHSAKGQASRNFDSVTARDYVVSVADDEMDGANGAHPLIIAEHDRAVHEMTVGEAVMNLDVTDQTFMIFRNAGHGGLNVVYRRPDGHIGWIDASPEGSIATNASARKAR